MNTKYTLPLATLSVLALAGCNSDAPQTAEVTVTETSTVEVTAEAAVETVTATETVTASPEPEEAEVEEADLAPPEPTTEPEPEAEGPEAESGEVDFGEAQFSPRGNLIKEVGQPAGILTEEDGEQMVTFTVTEIEKNVQCTSRIADAPENGQFVAFTFEVETFPALAAEDEWSSGTFSISHWDLTAFSLDGKRENDISGAAMWCLDTADELPSSLGPGQKAEGKVIIDTALDEGVLVYEESPFSDVGWEWEF